MHRKVDETPGWWFKQLDLAGDAYKKARRLHFREQLSAMLSLRVPEIRCSTRSDDFVDQREAPVGTEQIDINYIYRYAMWVQSQTFDRHPETQYPRYAGTDAQTGDTIAELLTRVGYEADEMEEWEGTIPEAISGGCFA